MMKPGLAGFLMLAPLLVSLPVVEELDRGLTAPKPPRPEPHPRRAPEPLAEPVPVPVPPTAPKPRSSNREERRRMKQDMRARAKQLAIELGWPRAGQGVVLAWLESGETEAQIRTRLGCS